jgi:HEAT repeat protein
MKRFVVGMLVLLGTAPRVWGYIDASPTLGCLIAQSDQIVVLQVDRVSREKQVVLYRKRADLKGKGAEARVKHKITEGFHPRQSRAVLDWAEPGRIAVCFRRGNVCETCLGGFWYECAARTTSWWTMTAGKPELSYTYRGSAARLRDHVTAILAGREVIVTALKYEVMALAPGPGNWLERRPEHWATYEAVGSGRLMRGKEWPLWRIRASLRMPKITLEVVRDPKAFLAGDGAGDAADVPALVRALARDEAGLRAEAAEELGLIGPPAAAAVPALLRACREAADPLLRVEAARAVACIDPKDAAPVPLLVGALADGAAKVRKRAAEALGDLGPGARPAVPALVKTAQDADAGVRWAALDALGQIGPAAEAAVPALRSALQDARVRGAAVDALGLIGRKAVPAVPALERLLTGDDAGVRWAAAAALLRVGGPGARAGVRYLLEKANPDGGKELYDAENLLVAPAAGDALRELLEAVRDPGVRDTAARVLRDKNFVPLTRDQIAEATRRLKDPDAGVRCVAAWVLYCRRGQPGVDLQSKDFLEVQVQALTASDRWARREAARFLGSLGPYGEDAAPALSAARDDADAGVREAAAAALKCIQGR